MSKRTTLAFRWRKMLAMLVGVLLYDGISGGRFLMPGYVSLISAQRSSCVVALVKVLINSRQAQRRQLK